MLNRMDSRRARLVVWVRRGWSAVRRADTSSEEQPRSPEKPLTRRTIALGGLIIVGVAAAAVVVLLRLFGSGTPADQARLEVVKTAGTIVVGTGGAVALLLAARRQRYTELGFVATERDATERRITELYTKAADQLGNEKAPVRLAGLYALERLADTNPDQLRTIVDVVCAYLRMPYAPAPERPGPDAAHDEHERYERNIQERQVRLTAQRILCRHLIPGAKNPWTTQRIDLGEANLTLADFANADFTGADFTRADLTRAILGEVDFTGAILGEADFTGADLTDADCKRAEFTGANLTDADCENTVFTGAVFTDAILTDAILTGVLWDANTTWPGGFDDRAHDDSEELEPGLFRFV
jgi:hypothetical protein